MKATAGYPHLGGEDFDIRIAGFCAIRRRRTQCDRAKARLLLLHRPPLRSTRGSVASTTRDLCHARASRSPSWTIFLFSFKRTAGGKGGCDISCARGWVGCPKHTVCLVSCVQLACTRAIATRSIGESKTENFKHIMCHTYIHQGFHIYVKPFSAVLSCRVVCKHMRQGGAGLE